MLDEVVVIGYGTTTKRRLQARLLHSRKKTSIKAFSMIQWVGSGKSSGLTITKPSGQIRWEVIKSF